MPANGAGSDFAAVVLRRPQAVIFDLDGVLVDTARLHGRAWKRAFDSLFAERGMNDSFDEHDDYRNYVDGRPRFEGVAAFLQSRSIELPTGTVDDEPGFETEGAIGNLKNDMFLELIDSEGVDILPGAQSLVEALAAQGVPMAVVSSSRNARRVLPDVIGRHIDVLIGGDDVAEMGIPGKPEPEMFIEGARRLGFEPSAAVVIEDAPVGVRAGLRGGFALVVGIDPDGSTGLDVAGADVVVGGVGELPTDLSGWTSLMGSPESALERIQLIEERLDGRPAVFLDYDGTLTPIVNDPAAANIGPEERAILADLAERAPLAIISGRGLDDVKSHVSVDGITYSGSHGFEILRSNGERFDYEDAAVVVGDLDEAEEALKDGTGGLTGVMIERKPYAIAVHTRRAIDDEARRRAGEVAGEVGSRYESLVVRVGKEIHELRPALDWHKGTALAHLLDLLPGDHIPLYIGDDDTDEDAFAEVRRRLGVGILVGETNGTESWAEFTLADPDETLSFLSELAKHVS